MFNWIKSEFEELKKLSNKKKTRMKDEQIIEAQKYFYCPPGDQNLVEAGEKFPLLSAEEILVIRMKASRRFNDAFNRNLEAKRSKSAIGQQVTNNINKYGNPGLGPGLVGQITKGHQRNNFNWPLTPGQAYKDRHNPKFSVHIKLQNGYMLGLDDKKELVKKLRDMEASLMNEIRLEEENSKVIIKKVKKRKLI